MLFTTGKFFSHWWKTEFSMEKYHYCICTVWRWCCIYLFSYLFIYLLTYYYYIFKFLVSFFGVSFSFTFLFCVAVVLSLRFYNKIVNEFRCLRTRRAWTSWRTWRSRTLDECRRSPSPRTTVCSWRSVLHFSWTVLLTIFTLEHRRAP